MMQQAFTAARIRRRGDTPAHISAMLLDRAAARRARRNAKRLASWTGRRG